MILLSDSR